MTDANLPRPALPETYDPYPDLPPKLQKFVDLVAEGVSHAEAYRRVGYSPQGAPGNASQLISNHTDLHTAIEMREAQTSALSTISRQTWISELKTIALLDPEEAKRWITAGVKVSLRDKLGGLMTLGKACGWLDQPEKGGGKQLVLDLSVDQHIEVHHTVNRLNLSDTDA